MKTITVLTAMFFASLLSFTAFVANAAENVVWETEASKCFNELNDAPLKDSINVSAVGEIPASPDTRWPGVYFGAVHFPEREGSRGTKKRNVCIKIAVMEIQVEGEETNWAGQYCYGAGYQARVAANCSEQLFRDTLIEQGGDVLMFSADGGRGGIFAFRLKLDSAGKIAQGEVAYDDGRSWSILLKKKTPTWIKKAGL